MQTSSEVGCKFKVNVVVEYVATAPLGGRSSSGSPRAAVGWKPDDKPSPLGCGVGVRGSGISSDEEVKLEDDEELGSPPTGGFPEVSLRRQVPHVPVVQQRQLGTPMTNQDPCVPRGMAQRFCWTRFINLHMGCNAMLDFRRNCTQVGVTGTIDVLRLAQANVQQYAIRPRIQGCCHSHVFWRSSDACTGVA